MPPVKTAPGEPPQAATELVLRGRAPVKPRDLLEAKQQGSSERYTRTPHDNSPWNFRKKKGLPKIKVKVCHFQRSIFVPFAGVFWV